MNDINRFYLPDIFGVSMLGFDKEKTEFDIVKVDMPEKYIINENATILFWKNGEKTISRRQQDDIFNKKIGFLYAHWQYCNKEKSRNVRTKILDCIKNEKMYDFLFENFKEKTGMTTNKANKYLASLEVEEPKNKEI